MQGTKDEVSAGVWRLRVYLGRNAKGQPIQRSETVRTGDGRPGSGVREADRQLARMVAEVAKGNTATGTETVGHLLDRFLEHAESIGRSPTTLREYRRIADTILRPELGGVRLARLTAVDLDRLYARLVARGLKPMTVRHVHALIGVALHQAEKWGLIDRNVSKRATPPPVHASQVEAPDPEQVRAIIEVAEAIEPAFAALLSLAALTGARRGELCALRWSDFDAEARTLRVARSIYETPGGGWGEKATKTHAARKVGLDDLGVEILRRHRDRSTPWPATSGWPWRRMPSCSSARQPGSNRCGSTSSRSSRSGSPSGPAWTPTSTRSGTSPRPRQSPPASMP